MSITSAALTSTHAVSPELSTVSLLLVGQAGGILGGPCFREGRTLLRAGERLRDRGYRRVTKARFETSITLWSLEEGVDEGRGLERREVVGALAEAHELDRHPELALHAEHDAALGGAVELREDDAGDVDDVAEHTGLGEAVLPGGGVEHEQHLVDDGLAGDHPLDLAELVHQPGLRVEAPGGVEEHGVGALLVALLDGVERDAGRVGALRTADDGGARPLTPRGELLGGRC